MAVPLPAGPHRGMRAVWTIRGFLFTPVALLAVLPLSMPFLIASAEGALRIRWFWMMLVAPLVLYVLWNLVYWRLYHARYAFGFQDDAVVIKKGVWFRRTIHIPLRRVQDVVLKEGPILGAYGLTTVHLQTAAQGQTNLAEGQLPGLQNGQEIAEELMRRIRTLRADL